MAELEDVLRRVERLESKDAIRELATAYAIACDEHDMPRLADLFTEDARFDAPNGAMVAQGKSAIVTMFEEAFKIRGPGYHWTHDVTVTLNDDPDTAHGLVLSHAETTPNGVVSIAAMRYEDDYRREHGGWLFARRVIHFLYYVPAAEYTEALSQSERVVMGGERHKADYPETLPAWIAFANRFGAP